MRGVTRRNRLAIGLVVLALLAAAMLVGGEPALAAACGRPDPKRVCCSRLDSALQQVLASRTPLRTAREIGFQVKGDRILVEVELIPGGQLPVGILEAQSLYRDRASGWIRLRDVCLLANSPDVLLVGRPILAFPMGG